MYDNKQNDQEPVAWMCNLLGDVVTDKPADNNGYTALYKSPKREPAQTAREMYQRGYAKAEKDLKREPLSDERLEFLVDKYHGYPKTLGREIEEAHGIGVENE